jgi:hypothetical protein
MSQWGWKNRNDINDGETEWFLGENSVSYLCEFAISTDGSAMWHSLVIYMLPRCCVANLWGLVQLLYQHCQHHLNLWRCMCVYVWWDGLSVYMHFCGSFIECTMVNVISNVTVVIHVMIMWPSVHLYSSGTVWNRVARSLTGDDCRAMCHVGILLLCITSAQLGHYSDLCLKTVFSGISQACLICGFLYFNLCTCCHTVITGLCCLLPQHSVSLLALWSYVAC